MVFSPVSDWGNAFLSWSLRSASSASQLIETGPPRLSLEKHMAARSSILAWRIPGHRRDWRATVHGVTESDTTEATAHTQVIEDSLPYLKVNC